MSNRTALEQAVYRDFGYADSPATAISNRVRGYLNDRHRRLLTLPGTEICRRETGPAVTLVANQAIYALDMPVQKVLSIRDTTNDQRLVQRDLDWYRRVDPDPQSGTQEYWIPMRWGPALRDVGGAGLWVASSDAADTNVNVSVETIDTNGSVTTVPANTDGGTRVAIGAATNHQRLLRFNADVAAVGVLSLFDAAVAGNTVSKILLGRTMAQFLEIALWPTPAAADTIVVDYVHYIRDFTVAYDEPQLPPDFHYLVALGAKIDEANKKDDKARVEQWMGDWNEGKRLLINFLNNHAETIIVPGELDDTGRSNLGANFPVGVW